MVELLDKELIETALKNNGRQTTVQRVVSMEAESALPKGENYLSTIYRVTLKVILGNGRPAKRSLILKVVPHEKAKTELVKQMGVFKSETMMYAVVLKEMEMLMEEFGDTSDVLWCRLVHYEPYTSLLLEDLKSSGFKMTRRQDCLDLDHALLVLRSLGRFHGMSKILEQRGIISASDYKPYSLVSDPQLIKYFLYYALQTLAKAMEDHWGPEWYDVAQKLKIPCDVLQAKMIEMGKLDESRFNCLNHGDCWSNNMMFKYDWQNRPSTMRFVDFQVAHYNSPAFDVLRLTYLSTHPTVRREHFQELMSCYFNSLVDTLKRFGYLGKMPTMEGFLDEVNSRLEFEGYVWMMYQFVTRSYIKDCWNLEKVMESEGAEGVNIEIYKNPELRALLEEDVRYLAEKLIPEAIEQFKEKSG